MIRVVSYPSEENPFVVIDKSAGIASAPLFEGEDNNAFYEASKLFPELLNVKGRKECEHGLLHRLDTATRGLLVIATTEEAYNNLLESQRNGFFKKRYDAECDHIADIHDYFQGFPDLDYRTEEALDRNGKCYVQSYFRQFGEGRKSVRPVVIGSGMAAMKKRGTKLYSTQIEIENNHATCYIVEGYRHQVRCHLAWIGYPVKGDVLYNPVCEGELKFTASGISFPHPITNKIVDITL